MDATWHNRKLARGALAGNKFVLTLRDLSADKVQLQDSLQQIKAQGVPNYFGEQRFGQEQGNVVKALGMFKGQRVDRAKRSIYLSAARSYIFNQILTQRVQQENWNQALAGEVWMLEGTKSIFGPEEFNDELAQRLSTLDIHPTGAMWGAGELRSQESVSELENKIAEQFPELCAGLAKADLRQERRTLRLIAKNIDWQFLSDNALQLSFELPPGAYATSVLAELGEFS